MNTLIAPSSALIVVDMQNAFLDPTNGVPVSGSDDLVRAVNARVDRAVRDQRHIFYTRDVDPTGHLGDGHDERMHPEVSIRGPVVDKGPGQRGGFSGFVLASTSLQDGRPGGGGLSPLAGLLCAAGVGHVEVVGVAADVCVSATAVDAVRLGYRASVNLDASAFVHAHPHGDQAAVDDLRAAGVHIEAPVRHP